MPLPPFARPTLSVRSSICLSVPSWSTAERWGIGLLWLLGAYTKSPPCYSGTHLTPTTTHPFPQTGSSQLPVKTSITHCDQTMPNTTVICIDSLWKHTIALPSSTTVGPLGAPLPKKGGNLKVPIIGRIVGFPYVACCWECTCDTTWLCEGVGGCECALSLRYRTLGTRPCRAFKLAWWGQTLLHVSHLLSLITPCCDVLSVAVACYTLLPMQLGKKRDVHIFVRYFCRSWYAFVISVWFPLKTVLTYEHLNSSFLYLHNFLTCFFTRCRQFS